MTPEYILRLYGTNPSIRPKRAARGEQRKRAQVFADKFCRDSKEKRAEGRSLWNWKDICGRKRTHRGGVTVGLCDLVAVGSCVTSGTVRMCVRLYRTYYFIYGCLVRVVTLTLHEHVNWNMCGTVLCGHVESRAVCVCKSRTNPILSGEPGLTRRGIYLPYVVPYYHRTRGAGTRHMLMQTCNLRLYTLQLKVAQIR